MKKKKKFLILGCDDMGWFSNKNKNKNNVIQEIENLWIRIMKDDEKALKELLKIAKNSKNSEEIRVTSLVPIYIKSEHFQSNVGNLAHMALLELVSDVETRKIVMVAQEVAIKDFYNNDNNKRKFLTKV